MIRQGEPRGEREKNHQRSNGPRHDETFTHIVELAIRGSLPKLAQCGAESGFSSRFYSPRPC